jgi:hypothetical protein
MMTITRKGSPASCIPAFRRTPAPRPPRCRRSLAEAFQHTVRGRHTETVEALRRLVELPSPPFAGWSTPVESLLAPLRTRPRFDAVAARLAENAR